MLDSEGERNIERIKTTATEIWGNMCFFGEIEVIPVPFCEFKWHMNIYNHFDVLLTYDRSILGIYVKIHEEYQSLRNLSTQEIIRGFKSCKQESLEHNFKALDDILKSML
jgi:hypothetical protein